jgi:hypothetical protein
VPDRAHNTSSNSPIIKLGAVQKKLTQIMVSEKALLPHSPKYSCASRCQIEQYGGLQKEIPPQICLLKSI